jgi:chemotaxis signal transduction protein
MGINYLICRRASIRVLVPAHDVDGVRELVVHAAPPDAPSWVAGIAVTEDAAVVVAALQADAKRSRTDVQRVVVLRRQAANPTAACGVLVDEVVELREFEPSPAGAGTTDWQRRDERLDGVVVDAEALTTALVNGGVR